jgi:hypothetical protein
MPSIASLISRLQTDYPQFLFKKASRFLWSPSDKTIYYADKNDDYAIFLLHELSHGLLNHADYNHDIELIVMERKAWDKVIELARDYDVAITSETIKSTLDTYRDWLHSRNACPNCKATGIQNGKKSYLCLACNHEWQVNEARICALRRYDIKK